MTKKPKLISSIRAKLVSAVAMLLVAVIMVVSSTYAWFTLSTAPEVTGISTQIGANGALEMALVPTSGLLTDIKSEVGDSNKAMNERNTTWGNLVDLSNNLFYGMNEITLLPSALNKTKLNASTYILPDNMLKTPVYGADGRIDELSPNTVFGNYKDGDFIPGSEYGFRAVGVASGMTKRQLAYSNAKSAANTAVAQAKNTASTSLKNNGATLANIAIQHAADDAAKYTQEDVTSLKNIVIDLLGSDNVTGSLEYIEIAYMQYILAYAASAQLGDNEVAWSTIEAAIAEENATLESVLNKLQGVTLPSEFTASVAKLQATIDTVESAYEDLEALTGDEITWTQLSVPLYKLADVDNMTVNNIPAKDIKTRMNDLINSVGGGLKVTMATGGGVYADIADHCGNYDASITIEEVKYNGLVLNNMTARMETATTVIPQYLPAIGSVVNGAGMYVGATDEVMPLTEFYGYIIDMAFRTNAAESNLLLQTDAIDRIYGEEGNNELTQGHGSSMTFKATSTGFSDEKVIALMECIRIVFFTKTENGNEILCEARLDTVNATVGADGVTAKMYIYVKELSDSAKDVNNNIVSKTDADTILYYYNDADQNYYDGAEFTTAAVVDMATILANENVATQEKKSEDGVIAPLTQNTAIAISALVYLDGDSLTNEDVAYEAATSVTGTANFQFASSANLTPMNYAPLQGGSTGNNAGGEQQGEGNS